MDEFRYNVWERQADLDRTNHYLREKIEKLNKENETLKMKADCLTRRLKEEENERSNREIFKGPSIKKSL